jgi:hypothetical protein
MDVNKLEETDFYAFDEFMNSINQFLLDYKNNDITKKKFNKTMQKNCGKSTAKFITNKVFDGKSKISASDIDFKII